MSERGGREGDDPPMFRPKDPQSSLFETSMLLPEEKRRRLEGTWAEAFRSSALPLIDEEAFRDLYCADNGRPNKAVQTVIGILLLKEMHDLTDEDALFNVEFNLAWHVALDLTPEEAHCCQKTLHNFRARLMADERGRLLFEETTGRMIDALGLGTERQRLDSTHITSNMKRLSRLGLFCETARVFLKELRRVSEERYEAVPAGLRGRYVREDGTDSSYGDARSSEGKRRLRVAARDVWRLVDRFRGDEEVKGLESYGLLERLLAEQCEVVAEPRRPSEGDDDAGDGGAPVEPKAAKEVRSDSLQSPHDADATYSGRKGKGYEAQLAETCCNGEKPELITYAEVTAACASDEDVPVPAVEGLDSRDIKPEELVVDTNYGSTENVMECGERGVELVSPVPGKEAKEPAEGEITKGDFEVDTKGEKRTRCPAGCEAQSEERDAETGKVEAVFAASSCGSCSLRERCPARRRGDGTRVFRTTVRAAVLARRRRYEKTEEFGERYAIRAGIEGTNSELKRSHGLGRLRVRGLLRVRLAVYLKALACNVKRMVKYLAERKRRARKAALEAADSSLRAVLGLAARPGARAARQSAIWRMLAAEPGYTLRALAA